MQVPVGHVGVHHACTRWLCTKLLAVEIAVKMKGKGSSHYPPSLLMGRKTEKIPVKGHLHNTVLLNSLLGVTAPKLVLSESKMGAIPTPIMLTRQLTTMLNWQADKIV